jgi:hypothetical protein
MRLGWVPMLSTFPPSASPHFGCPILNAFFAFRVGAHALNHPTLDQPALRVPRDSKPFTALSFSQRISLGTHSDHRRTARRLPGGRL